VFGPTSAFSLNPEEKSRIDFIPAQSLPLVNQGSYVLFSDDNIRWNYNLPSILTRRQHDQILDRLFKFSMPWALRVVPQLFLRDMHSSLSSPHNVKTEYYSPMLHNALITLGCCFSDDLFLHDSHWENIFLMKAKSFMDAECKKPRISTIQALGIIATYYANHGQETLGYMYSGMAGCLCQACKSSSSFSFSY
jgi:Fungal specific transcription factor domain